MMPRKNRLRNTTPEGVVFECEVIAQNKNGPSARRCAEAIKSIIFLTARQGSGYPSGVPIEAGNSGSVCPIVNRTRKIR
jgi:hypothetical protein